MSEKVFKNASHYILASLLPIAVSVLMLPIYTLYLSPTDYGILALVLSLQAFLPILMTLQIQGSIPRFYFEYCDDKAKLKVFISTILLFVVILSTVAVFFLSTYLDEILDLIFPKTIGYNDIFCSGCMVFIFNSVFIIIY
jgi:O-antigen/teichoic acid export membrane protein